MTSDGSAVDRAVQHLREVIGAPVTTEAAVLDGVRRDSARWDEPSAPCAAVLASERHHVTETLRLSAEHGIPVTVRGAGTGLSGGADAVVGGIVIDVSGMNRILAIDPEDAVAVVEPGVLTRELDLAAARHGLAFAPDPASSALSTVGGNIATNAGGLRSLKYGVTRDAVLGVTLALSSGEVVSLGGRTRKNVTGLDLLGLVVGSEGTLGVILDATVRLIPRPFGQRMITVGCASLDSAQAAVRAVMSSRVTPSLFEMLDRGAIRARGAWFPESVGLSSEAAAILLIETDGFGAEPEAKAITAALGLVPGLCTVDLDDVQRERAIDYRRGTAPLGEGDAQVGAAEDWWLGEDMTVPPSRLAEFLVRAETIVAERGVVLSLVAHIGEGSLHPSLSVPRESAAEAEAKERLMSTADELVRCAIALGGAITGEHGVGRLKRRWTPLVHSPSVTNLQSGVRALFDPARSLPADRAF